MAKSSLVLMMLVGSVAWAGPNSPEPFGSGYTSWSTRGGATLSTGNGARAGISAGGGGYWGGYGNFSLEGMYLWNVSSDFDFGLGGRIPLWPLGLSPGVDFRPRLLNKGRFQLALDIGLYVPMFFAGYYYVSPRFGPPVAAGVFHLGLSAEPAVMMSYFIRDCMEVYFGVMLPIGLGFVPGPFTGDIGIVHRVGFAFNFKKQNVGVYGNFDFGPRFFFPFYGYFWGAFQAGAQFRFGG